jgi:hypothetical protein
MSCSTKRVVVAGSIAAFALSGCYVVPVAPEARPPTRRSPFHLAPVAAAPSAPYPAVLHARLYPANDMASRTGMLSGTVTNMMTGKGRFQLDYAGEVMVGEATRVRRRRPCRPRERVRPARHVHELPVPHVHSRSREPGPATCRPARATRCTSARDARSVKMKRAGMPARFFVERYVDRRRERRPSTPSSAESIAISHGASAGTGTLGRERHSLDRTDVRAAPTTRGNPSPRWSNVEALRIAARIDRRAADVQQVHRHRRGQRMARRAGADAAVTPERRQSGFDVSVSGGTVRPLFHVGSGCSSRRWCNRVRSRGRRARRCWK